MTSYHLRVALLEPVTSVSCPPALAPPVPTPDNHRESFRCACLVKYFDARLAGLDHVSALREATRSFRLAGHPWGFYDLVAKEVNQALGRRPGRSRRGQP